MFVAVAEIAASAPREARPVEATTVTVGRKTTQAKFFMPGVDHVIRLLEQFVAPGD
jgi:hypothetical protein